MQTILIKWLLFFFLIPTLEGSQKLRKFDEFATVETTVKTILESCYENDKSPDPIVIFGDFNEFIDASLIIRVNNSLNISDDRWLNFKASRVVLVGNTPEQFESDLILLSKMEWWDHMTPFFIIAKYQTKCENFADILNTTWTMDVINSLYICAESMDTSVLYTLNLMANYAPHPWEKMEELKHLNVFCQVFHPKISCKNLNFDKTRILHGYEVKFFHPVPEGRQLAKLDNLHALSIKLLQLVVTALNASSGCEIEMNSDSVVIERNWLSSTSNLSDISVLPMGLRVFHEEKENFLYPHVRSSRVAVVKLKPEVTTLEKIYKLWSIPVLIATTIAFACLILILTIKNNDFVAAMLDVVRLLTYTSIRTNDRTHSFRIYFTTMLILMIISNGVFQGKIASFLTKRDRGTPVGTINEAADLRYKMFGYKLVSGALDKLCPKCNVERVSKETCINHVLNNTNNLCVIWEEVYFAEFSHLSLDYIPEAVEETFLAYKCRKHWALKNRFDEMLLKVNQNGIIDSWQKKVIFKGKYKRVAREAEWSSAQYRPVKLYKLKFAFQLLALGLLLSSIVFILELHLG